MTVDTIHSKWGNGFRAPEVVAELEMVEPTQPDERVRCGDATCCPPDRRTQVIAGLRDLATWLEAHPDVKVPTISPEMSDYIQEEDDDAGRTAVERQAAALGVPVVSSNNKVWARVTFSGGVSYSVIYLSRRRVAEWAALMSYSDSVQLEGGEPR